MKNSITKKLFLALLVLCTIAVALAACGTKKAPGSGGATTDPADSPAPESSSVEKTPSLGGDSPVIIPSRGDDPIPTVSLNPECQHMTALDPAVAPTCTQNGKSEGSHCSRCGGVLVAQTEIPATGHNWIEATCESPKTCSVCSETEGAAKGHDWQDATCILQKTCNTCGKAEGNALGHDYKDGFCTRCGVGKPSEGLSYTENEDGYVVSGIGICRDSNLVIPEEHEGKPVVAIAEGAFKDLKKINSLYVPGSVQTIGKEAFSGCTGLTKITLCEGISEIDDKAFAECEAGEIVVPKSVSRLGNGVFYKCISLTKATLGVQTIASETFNSCTGLTTVLLTEGVKTIDAYAFEYCFNLQSVSFPVGLTTIGKCAFSNCALKTISLPDSVITLEDGAFIYCDALEDLNLPAGLEILGKQAFAGTGLKSVIIPASVTEMGEGVFEECEVLEKITFAAGITKIPAGAFAGIAGLKEIVVPESVLTIEEGAFGGCTGLKAITLAEGLTTIGNGAFSGCNGLEQVVIPESVNTIGAEAFKDCKNLATVTFKNTGWTELAIGDYAFSGTALTSVVIPEGMTTISAAFSGLPSLKSVTFHDAVTAITNNAFDGCSGLTAITIPSGVTEIGKFAFYDCAGLTEVVVPNSVTQIGWGAFGGCTNLREITLPFVGYKDNSGTPSWDVFGFIFGDDDKNDTGAYSTYEYGMASGLTSQGPSYKRVSHSTGYFTYYDYYYNYYAIPTSLRKVTITKQQNIPDYAFDNCDLLTEIILPEGVKNIGDYVFENCRGIRSITLGKDLESIGHYAFNDCRYLVEVINLSNLEIIDNDHYSSSDTPITYVHTGPSRISTEGGYWFYSYGTDRHLLGYSGEETDLVLPEGITHIAVRAFYKSGVTNVVIPGSVTSIGDSAFQSCSELRSIAIPDSVTSIGASAFDTCSSLESVVIGNGVTSIGSNAFYECWNLTSVTIGNNVTSIGDSAFRLCSELRSIVIPDSVTSIGSYAFGTCSSLESVVIGNGVTSIGECAFYSCSGLTSISIPGSVTTMGMYAFNACYDLVSIWCEASSQPEGWDEDWNYYGGDKVYWGAKGIGLVGGVACYSSLYDVCDYDGKGGKKASAWELYPYTPGDTGSVGKNTHFHLCLLIDKYDIDAYTGIGTEEYPYTWKIYYKDAYANESYKMVEGAPWGAISLGNNKQLYRVNLMDYGMEKPNVGDTYHMIFVICDKEGTAVAWTDLNVQWTDSSEAYYQDALKYDLIG